MKNTLDSEHTLKSRIDNAVSFVPNNNTQLAIVPLGMLIKLTSELNKGSQYSIIVDFKHALTKASKGDNALELAIETAQEFIDFHKTVNLIEKYEKQEVVEEILGKIDGDDALSMDDANLAH